MDFETIDRIAYLMRLRVNEEEKERFLESLNQVLDFVTQLEGVETDNVLPLVNVATHEMFTRLDAITDGNCAEDVLQNAPEKGQGMFIVPKVVE